MSSSKFLSHDTITEQATKFLQQKYKGTSSRVELREAQYFTREDRPNIMMFVYRDDTVLETIAFCEVRARLRTGGSIKLPQHKEWPKPQDMGSYQTHLKLQDYTMAIPEILRVDEEFDLIQQVTIHHFLAISEGTWLKIPDRSKEKLLEFLPKSKMGMIVVYPEDRVEELVGTQDQLIELPKLKESFVCIHPRRTELSFMVHEDRYGTKWEDDLEEVDVHYEKLQFATIEELGKHFGESHASSLTGEELELYEKEEYVSLTNHVQQRLSKYGEFNFILWKQSVKTAKNK